MRTFTIRPYFGHDCDSEQGFNNGHYLSELVFAAADEQEAIDKAQAYILREFVTDPKAWDADNEFGDGTLYSEFGHVWVTADGEQFDSEEELPRDPDTDGDPVEAECHYRYQYIDFNDVTEATAAKAGAP